MLVMNSKDFCCSTPPVPLKRTLHITEVTVQIKLWGTRGSMPRAMTHDRLQTYMSYLMKRAKNRGITDFDGLQRFISNRRPLTFGGNTTCTEIRDKKDSYFVDFGTGLTSYAELGKPNEMNHYIFFLSHLHWDHISGLPFFPPIYDQDSTIDIFYVHKGADDYLASVFNGVNFPVRWQELSAYIRLQRLFVNSPIHFDTNLKVTPFKLDHPGDSFGYRFDNRSESVAIAVDNELQRRTADELGEDLECYQELDLLLFDSQYESSELAHRYDWGHSSPTLGVDLAYREMIKKLVLVHHDPLADDEKLRKKIKDARSYARKIYPQYRKQWQFVQKGGPRIVAGYDGLEIDVG